VIGRPGLFYQTYEWRGRTEFLMRIGDPAAPAILFIPPLFEEMNRTRSLIAGAMRGLAARGFSCWLADLPGTGESERRLEETSWDDWRGAVTGIEVGAIGVASLRGGCLLDDAVGARTWRLAPATGASLLRDLSRAGAMGGAKNAGYPIGDDLISSLSNAVPAETAPLRTTRLSTDPGPADAKFEGPALWRRSEPAGSPALAEMMAADMAAWFAA